ncbi:hypothetical protein [Sphingomicrobium lutaoense]|uniref:Lipocalin-like domain-containing protein n=1 Tax=Sphingomicrobium lutaoense TaxID=515949 RepID=A0A839YYQ2_9SPHN|nr:hypothetical protein [Sphingomicrobium lutaoense]MBB3764116.1 hypothetical protein [Sphingomicrobium lutaoense]
MKKWIILAGAATLAACAESSDVTVEEENVLNEAAATTETEMMSLAGTTWEFTRDDVSYIESIDNDGNYIAETADGEHADHGTYEMVDDKACFTSAMTEEGTVCWTVSDVAVGESMVTTSDKGEEISVKRVEYREMSMPSS